MCGLVFLISLECLHFGAAPSRCLESVRIRRIERLMDALRFCTKKHTSMKNINPLAICNIV